MSFKRLTMAINGPKEAPNTITTIKPSLTKFKGEKSQIFTPKILSCFSMRQKEKKNQIILPLLHIYGLTGRECCSAFQDIEKIPKWLKDWRMTSLLEWRLIIQILVIEEWIVHLCLYNTDKGNTEYFPPCLVRKPRPWVIFQCVNRVKWLWWVIIIFKLMFYSCHINC